MDGKEFPGPINAEIVKKYYAWDNKRSDLLELKTYEGSSGRQKWREIELEEAEWVQARYEHLNLIEEKRMKAICHG